ncbi:MAG: ABC transporter permease [Planctomycetes bacterium]|nr:ABC transporter permease [Planctomycetota bacterium]
MYRILALTAKDLRLLLRDKVGFFFTFFFPVLYATFFGFIFSGQGGDGPGIKLALVDEDRTDGSRAFIERLRAAPEVTLVLARTDGSGELTREDAVALVRRGRAAAYVVLAAGFGDRADQPFHGGPLQLETGCDPSRQAEAGMLQGILTRYVYQGMQETFADRAKLRQYLARSMVDVRQADELDPAARAALNLFLPAMDQFLANLPEGQDSLAGFQSLEIKNTDVARQRRGPKNPFEISFPQGIIWGILGCAAGFGISMVSERTKGTLVRLRMAPITPGQVLAGKALACFLTTTGVATLLLTLAAVAFQVRPGSVPLLALAVVSVSLAFVGIMMFLSVLGKTEQSAGGIGWAILTVMAMIGGGMVPLAFLPAWMATVGHVSPVKWAILAIEGAIWRGFSATEMLGPCAILLGFGALFFLIGARAFRWSESG